MSKIKHQFCKSKSRNIAVDSYEHSIGIQFDACEAYGGA